MRQPRVEPQDRSLDTALKAGWAMGLAAALALELIEPPVVIAALSAPVLGRLRAPHQARSVRLAAQLLSVVVEPLAPLRIGLLLGSGDPARPLPPRRAHAPRVGGRAPAAAPRRAHRAAH